ncbi:hypothetical protein ASF04_12005 [Duganella sp. Leaf61]|uniref:pyridoxamine 5'-phosphate oxidase family protein n=1 Tax=Duganella sp. Leaf61 TaxID=1736227 RepID=UPI0006F3B3FD|nr:pyridoxamine 5'-phosphate oxidase family protein [Duganella sp. Leaf61]KQN70550.1 hypothetical protein ASF04_12005 [Duganella sp. Leaf61]
MPEPQALDPTRRQFVLDLLTTTHDLTLATLRPDGYPHATVVSFVHDGLTLYAGIGIDSQKSHNIRHCNRVSATITAPYANWREIRGVSLAGSAAFVDNATENAHVADLMLYRFPEARQFLHAGSAMWPGALFVRIAPRVISVLDYTCGFGHTELFTVNSA